MSRAETPSPARPAWKQGDIGVIHGDKEWHVTARAEVIWANTRQIKVMLLEDFYCCEAGEEIRTATRLFTQGGAS